MRNAQGRQHGLPAGDQGTVHRARSIYALRRAVARLCLAFLLIAVLIPAHADVKYVYDNAGRLVQVIAADGSSAEYEYDAAGNITAIRRFASSDLALVAFAPASGAAGAAVTIHGSGFSTTPSGNAVSFNGVTAAVLSASANSLSVQVPSGASIGPISVTVGGTTVASTQAFVVVSPPTITGFSPTVVNAGNSVALTGSNLNPVPGSTQVVIGTVAGIVTSAAATQLAFTVPGSTRTSPITVRTPHGEATSVASLIVAPPSIGAANVAASGEVTPGGAAVPLTIGAGKYGLFAFQATAGQYLTVQTSALSTTPGAAAVSYQVFSPSNSVFASGPVSASSPSIHLAAIPASGIYLVAFSAGTAALQISASLEINHVFSPTGALTATTAGAQQSKRFFVTATAGQHIGVGLSSLVLTPNSGSATLAIYKPDGGLLDSVGCGTSGPCARTFVSLPQTGNYRVMVTPSVATTMSFTLTVSEALTGALSAGTAFSVNLPVTGNFAVLSFTATAGQTLALNLGSIVTSPAGRNIWFGVYGPSGTQIAGQAVNSSHTYNFTNLAAGTYKVQLSPFDGVTANMQVLLGNGLTGTLTVDGSSNSFSTSVPWQAGYFTFTATAGQHVGVGLSNLVLTPSSGGATLAVFRPNGTLLDSVGCNTSGPCARSLYNLPQTGTYRVTVTPTAATTMSFTLTVSEAVTGTLNPGTPLPISVSLTGQFAVLSFTATAGQTVALNLGSIVTSPAGRNIWFGVYNPSGTQIAGQGVNSLHTYNLTNLAAGTYKVQLSPFDGVTANMQVLLGDGVTGTLPVDGSSNSFSTSVPWQFGYFTFSGTAGQHIGVALSNLSLTPNSGGATLQVLKPDGGQLASTSCSTAGPCAHHLFNLPQTGTYAVRVMPSSATVMSFTLTVSEAVTGALSLGTPMAVNLPIQGQFGVFTFTASAGQTVAANLKSIVTSPAGTNVWFAVYGPNGAQVAGSGHNSNITYNLTNLAAGTYKVQVSPFFGVTASAELTVANGLTATLPVDGSSNSFSTTVPAQVGYFTFSGTAGQHIGVALSNLSLTPNSGSATLQVLKPDGGQLASTSCNTAGPCAHHLFNLPQTGTYAVRVTPSATVTMSFTLNVSNAVTGTLSAGTPLSVNLPVFGQFGVYTFSATAGQSLAVTVNSIVTGPTGNNVWVAVYNPSNVSIAGSGSSSSVTHNLNNLPAGTYKVTVMPFFGVTASAQVSYQ